MSDTELRDEITKRIVVVSEILAETHELECYFKHLLGMLISIDKPQEANTYKGD